MMEIDFTKKKKKMKNKTIYISDDYVKKIDEIAAKYDTSFNNTLISIIESYFNDKKNKK